MKTQTLGILIAAAALARGPAAARAERFEDVDIAPLPTETIKTTSGYLEQRFRVTNQGARARVVTLELRSRHGGEIGALRRSVTVGPGSAATVSLFKPALNNYGFEADILRDGRRIGTLTDKSLLRGHSRAARYADPQIVVLISRRFNPAAFEKMFEMRLRRPSEEAEKPTHLSATFVRAEQDVSSWSGHWLAYSRFDGVVVSEADLAGAPEDVRDALRRYTEAGGSLWIVAEGAARLYGEPLGFGRRWRGLDPQTVSPTAEDTAALAEDWRRVNQDGRDRSMTAEIPAALLPIEKGGLPVGMILLLMSGFAVIIGPVNWIVAHRRRRPIMLLWTTPLLSLAMTGALFAYGLASEGVTPRSRARALTLLDQAERRAVSLALLSWYAPLAPRSGLHFSFDTELSPLNAYRESAGGRGIDWTRDQHWTGGWLPARMPIAMRARKAEPRRERIAVTADGGRLRIVNGLGADLAALWLMDREGRLHRVGAAPAGGEATLEPQPAGAAPGALPDDLFSAAASGDWLEACAAWEKTPAAVLRPGMYLAVLNDSPFVETGLAGRQIADRRAWVVGRLAPEDMP